MQQESGCRSCCTSGDVTMSRVLIPVEGAWYDELKTVGYYGESDLEREIRQHVRSLFPDFFVFPFKKKVVSKSTAEKYKPDLAMVRRDFSAWGIIEIELSEHDLDHVLKQTGCFVDGTYNAPETAAYIHRQMKTHCGNSASLPRLEKLIGEELPTVLVMADAQVDAWKQQLKASGIDLCVFQVFKNLRGRHIYRTLGDYPAVAKQEAHCRRHPSVSNLVEIVGKFKFKRVRKNKHIDIIFDAHLTHWAVVVDKGRNYLRFMGKVNPLPPNATYFLCSDSAHKYYFRIN
jgi:hypothetical protein